jgi:hypothetical protein
MIRRDRWRAARRPQYRSAARHRAACRANTGYFVVLVTNCCRGVWEFSDYDECSINVPRTCCDASLLVSQKIQSAARAWGAFIDSTPKLVTTAITAAKVAIMNRGGNADATLTVESAAPKTAMLITKPAWRTIISTAEAIAVCPGRAKAR